MNSTKNKSIIYLVLAIYDYSSSHSIKAFVDNKKAILFMTKCITYEKTKPEYPNNENYNSSEWNEFDKKEELWRKKHPAGEDNANADGFFIKDIILEK